MTSPWIQLAMALSGSLGFCMVFRLRAVLLVPAALGSFFCWGVYLLATGRLGGLFVPCLLATAAGALYAELLARLCKAPSTVFFIPAVLPLIPGSSLYYTMYAVMQNDWAGARAYGADTLQIALAIAAGSGLVWALCDMLRKLRTLRRDLRRRLPGHPDA